MQQLEYKLNDLLWQRSGRWANTVKLKVKTVRTDSLEEFEKDKNYGGIVRTRRGTYELYFPTKLNEKLKPLMGKDFDMDVVKDGETLRITLTHNKPNANEANWRSNVI